MDQILFSPFVKKRFRTDLAHFIPHLAPGVALLSSCPEDWSQVARGAAEQEGGHVAGPAAHLAAVHVARTRPGHVSNTIKDLQLVSKFRNFRLIPDVRCAVHGVLLQGELGAGYLHGAGEDGLQRELGRGEARVHRHVVHQPAAQRGGGERGRRGAGPRLRVDRDGEARLGVDLLHAALHHRHGRLRHVVQRGAQPGVCSSRDT